MSYQVNQFPEVNSENSITFLQNMLSFRITKQTRTADLVTINIALNDYNESSIGEFTINLNAVGVVYRVRYEVDYSTSTNLTLGTNPREMEITLPSECTPSNEEGG